MDRRLYLSVVIDSPMFDKKYVDYNATDLDKLMNKMEETYLDNKTIYNSLDNETVVIGEGLNHDNKERSNFGQKCKENWEMWIQFHYRKDQG